MIRRFPLRWLAYALALFVVACSAPGNPAGGSVNPAAVIRPPPDLTCPAYDGSKLPAPLPVSATPAAGKVSGRFSVTPQGQANYEIPIVVPPGRLGMEPHLSIKYDSSSGDGPLGVGFSIAGLSAVTRCPRTLAEDGVAAAVEYSEADALCLDGLRLVPVAASGRTAEGTREYRTLPDTFSKIVAHLTPGGMPASFDVLTKSGHVLQYGVTAESQVTTGTGIIASWWISRESDRRGNDVSYFYDNTIDISQTVEMLPRAIGYADRSVTFQYRARDVFHQSFSGGMVQMRQHLLESVQVFGPGALPVRTYAFSYRKSTGTRRELLESVTECTGGGDTRAGSVCRPPTRFSWTDAPARMGPPVVTPPIARFITDRYDWVLADVNGDGLADIVAVVPSADRLDQSVDVMVSLATGQSFAPPQRWISFPEPERKDEPKLSPWTLTAMDIDQDGLTDVFLGIPRVKPSSWPAQRWLRAKPGGGFELRDTAVPRPDTSAGPQLGDVNGDGIADLIQCDDASGAPAWRLFPWTPSTGGFGPAPVAIDPLDQEGFGCGALVQTADVRGAGAADLLMAKENNPNPPPLTIFSLWAAHLEKGGWTWNQTEIPGTAVSWLDANGDGLPDTIVPNFSVANPGDTHSPGALFLSTGHFGAKYFALPDQPPPNAFGSPVVPRVTLDYDGDGQGDLLVPLTGRCPPGTPPQPNTGTPGTGRTCYSVLLSSPSGLGGDTLIDTPLRYDSMRWFTPRITDVNGDGRHDVVVPNIDTAGTFNDGTFLVYTTGGPQDLLSAATDGMSPLDPGDPGFVPSVAIVYGNLIDDSITRGFPVDSAAGEGATYLSRSDPGNDCTFPRACVKGSERVVSRYLVNDGENRVRSFSVKYRDGRYHRTGRGFLGFGERIVLDEDAGSGVAEFYDTVTYDPVFDTYPFAGQVVESWAWSPAHAIGGGRGSTQVELVYANRSLLQVTTSAPTGDHDGTGTYFVFAWNTEVKREETMFAPSSGSTLYQLVRDTAVSPATILGDTHTVVSGYDLFGNVLAQDTYTDGVDLHDSVSRAVSNDPASWLIGLVKEEQACSATASATKCRTRRAVYNSLGEAVSVAAGDPGDPGTQIATDYQRDTFGNVVLATATDAHGDRRASCVTYEPGGVFPHATRNTLGHTSYAAFDAGLGVPTASVDPNGLATLVQHDAFGRVTKVVAPDGTFTTSTLTRSKNGGPAGQWWMQTVTTAESQGPTTTVELDGAGRPVHSLRNVAAVEACGKAQCASALTLEQWTQYDAFGRVSRATLPWMHGDALAGQLADTYAYDDIGRPTEHVEPWGRKTTYAYGENVTTATDWLGSSSAVVDALGRTVATVDKLGGAVRTDYGPFSLPIAVTRHGTEVTTYQRDAYGRVLVETDPDRGATASAYNGFGDVIALDDALGRHVDLTYDGIGRRVQRTDSGNGPHGSTTWTFDTAPYGVGLLASVTSPENHQDSYTYTPLSRIASHTLALGDTGESFTWRMHYDGLGRPSELQYPTAPGVAPLTVRREYDANSNLIALHDDATGTTFWQLQRLDGAGRASAEHLGNGVFVDHTYKPESGQLLEIRADWVKSKLQQAAVQDLTYTYDLGLRMTSRSDLLQPGAVLGPATEIFHHDAGDRLTCASVSTGIVLPGAPCGNPIAYAPNGNIQAKDGLAFAYDDPSHPHAVTTTGGPGGSAYAYDAVGNQIRRPGTHHIAYTAFDLPSRYQLDDGGIVQLAYDGNQHRIRKQSDQGETISFDDVYERVRVRGVEHRFYVAAGSSTVVVTRAAGRADQTYYLLTDALGSTDVVTDGTGSVVERRSYDAFGARRNPAWGGATPAAFPSTGSTMGFTGQEADDEHQLGLVNMRGRIYDPKLGRFLQMDPLVSRPHLAQSWNPYSYVWNSPLSFTDPSGFGGESPDAGSGRWTATDAPGGFGLLVTGPGSVPPPPAAGPLAPTTPPPPDVAAGQQGDTGRGDVAGPEAPTNGAGPGGDAFGPATGVAFNKFNPYSDEGRLFQGLFGAEPPPRDLCDDHHEACLQVAKATAGFIPVVNSTLVLNDPHASTGEKAFAVASDGLVLLGGVGIVIKGVNTVAKAAKAARAASFARAATKGFSARALAAADLGLSGKGLLELTGSVVDAGGTRVITVDMIQAVTEGAVPVGELRRALPQVLEAARAEGVTTLQIEARFANDKLRAFVMSQAESRGGTATSLAGRETITFTLGGL